MVSVDVKHHDYFLTGGDGGGNSNSNSLFYKDCSLGSVKNLSRRDEHGPVADQYKDHYTLRALLSGTFLQTLPDLVTPLKGYSLSPPSCAPTRSAPSERFGYWYDCGSNLAPKHARKHETHPPRVTKKFRLDSNDFGFIWAGVSNMAT